MIIYIDRTIADHGDFTEQENTMFTELACAHKRGNCFLCGHTLSIDRLKKDIPAYCKGIDDNHAELRSLFGEVETLIVITYGEEPALPKAIEEKMNALLAEQDRNEQNVDYVRVVSVDQATRYRLNEQCIFLGESTNDCTFYRLLADRYMHSIRDKIRGVSLSLKDENGGGQMTYNQLEKCVKTEHHLTVCLTDSDKKHGISEKFVNKPGLGNTASSLEKTRKTLEKDGLSPLFDLLTLDVHEAENLLPLSILDDIVKHDVPDGKNGLAYLRLLQEKRLELNKKATEQHDQEKEKYPEVMFCYDIKKGVNVQKLKQDLEDPERSKKVSKPLLAYWEEVIEVVGDDRVSGIAEKALTYAMKHMAELTPSGHKKVIDYPLDEYLVDHWKKIGKKIFSWGIANTPKSTRPSAC